LADPVLGNRATEQAEFDAGKDFEGIGSSCLPMSAPMLEVRVENQHGDMVVKPLNPRKNGRSLELRHSETDLLAAQLTEEPELENFLVPVVGQVVSSPSRIQKAMSRNQNREQLVWFGIDSSNLSAALGDRIIVRRDTLESEYVCQSCKGKGHTDEVCKLCDGKQQKDGVACGNCRVIGFEAESPSPSGFSVCPDCRGVGWKNGIIIPEVAQGKPVTGVVVSIGPETKLCKLGDRVLHSKYAGHTLEMKAETYTYMRETEVISLLRDL
jgi:co-chaperonin GroES (HSP10)